MIPIQPRKKANAERNIVLTEHKKDIQAVIFDAACKVIREKGFHQTRITDIAQTAGISYGLVYHYFKSKSELFLTIQKEWLECMLEMMDQTDMRFITVEEKLAAIINFFLDMYEKRTDLVYIFVTEISRSTSNLNPDTLKWFKIFLARTEKIIAMGQSEKILRSDVKAKYLTHILLGSLETFISTMVVDNQTLKSSKQKQRIGTALLEVFLNGASPRSGKNPLRDPTRVRSI